MNKPDVSILIAKVLAGSWRPLVLPLEISEAELLAATPWLLQSGAGSLGWRRAATCSLATSDAGQKLQQAYRLHTLQALRHERDIKRVLSVLRKYGIEPILVKGWSVARLYPEPGLRPYGDIDLCVPPGDFAATKILIKSIAAKTSEVDLHRSFQAFDHHSWDEMKSRSHLTDIDGLCVRTLSAEDQLRLICFHFLREGAWRPLWLCDIAVALESRPENFDWELFLGRKGKSQHWFACAILLAHYLVEASLGGVPSLVTSRKLPRWFVPSVLAQWKAPSVSRRHRTPISRTIHSPLKTFRGLGAHWPSPIEGTIGVRGPFNDMPRLPFQLGQCFVRAAKYFRRLPEIISD